MKIRVIDVAQDAIQAFGVETTRKLAESMGRQFEEHDYRFEVIMPDGRCVCFNKEATAEYVQAYMIHDYPDFVSKSTLLENKENENG